MLKRCYNPDAARRDILDAFERLFAERGFADVSTGTIATQAGVSQSQIHDDQYLEFILEVYLRGIVL